MDPVPTMADRVQATCRAQRWWRGISRRDADLLDMAEAFVIEGDRLQAAIVVRAGFTDCHCFTRAGEYFLLQGMGGRKRAIAWVIPGVALGGGSIVAYPAGRAYVLTAPQESSAFGISAGDPLMILREDVQIACVEPWLPDEELRSMCFGQRG